MSNKEFVNKYSFAWHAPSSDWRMVQSANKAARAEAKTPIDPENQGHDKKHSPKPPRCDEHWEKDTRGVASISQKVPYGNAQKRLETTCALLKIDHESIMDGVPIQLARNNSRRQKCLRCH